MQVRSVHRLPIAHFGHTFMPSVETPNAVSPAAWPAGDVGRVADAAERGQRDDERHDEGEEERLVHARHPIPGGTAFPRGHAGPAPVAAQPSRPATPCHP